MCSMRTSSPASARTISRLARSYCSVQRGSYGWIATGGIPDQSPVSHPARTPLASGRHLPPPVDLAQPILDVPLSLRLGGGPVPSSRYVRPARRRHPVRSVPTSLDCTHAPSGDRTWG